MRIFQTFLLQDEQVRKYKLSFAAANFSRNLINGGGFDNVYSLMPLTVSGELPKITDDGYEVVYSKWRKKGRVLAKLAIFHEQWKIFKQVKRGDSLWLYNLNIINALLFVLIRLFKSSVKLNIIMLDFTPARSWRDQNYWYLKLINRADGIICLGDSSLYTVKNIAVLAGVVPSTTKNNPKIDNPNKEFLLSGVISPAIASTSMVLEAFSRMPEYILHITGNVLEGEDMIKEYAARHTNIKYHGALAFEDYLKIMHKVTYQLSTRDESFPENKYNFPSKIIETLLHNRIVISTIAYKQLDGIKYFKVDSNCEAFERQISEICSKPNEVLMQYANQGALVTNMFSAEVWNKTMTDIENYRK
jgi:hypothetical protein